MKRDASIFVAGHRGMVGSAIVRRLHALGFHHIVTRTHAELDLLDQRAVNEFLASQRLEGILRSHADFAGKERGVA